MLQSFYDGRRKRKVVFSSSYIPVGYSAHQNKSFEAAVAAAAAK